MTASSLGVIFDLDGVLTDTAEFHYLAWQALADAEDIPFDRETNEHLRGVSRRDSLLLLLQGRQVDEASLQDMMQRKNDLYLQSLQDMTPQDTLPGAIPLVLEAKRRGMRVAIGSSSKNAPFVLDKLGIAGLFDAVADGNSVEEAKPAPDLFLHAAEQLHLPPGRCIVVEDAASGVDAALAAGMTAIGIGPAERVGHAHHRWAATADVDLDAIVPPETTMTRGGVVLADGWLITDGDGVHDALTSAEGGWVADIHVPTSLPVAYSADDGATTLVADAAPTGASVSGTARPSWKHGLDIRYRRHRRHVAPSGPVRSIGDSWFVPMDQPHLLVRRQVVDAPPGTAVTCHATIDVTAWLGESARIIGPVGDRDGVWCVELETEDRCLLLAMTMRVTGGEMAAGDPAPDGQVRLHLRGDVEVGEGGRATVEQLFSIHGAGAAPAAAQALGAAVSQGFEPLLARHALAWESLWSASDVVVDDPALQTLARYDRAVMLFRVACEQWPSVRGASALLERADADLHDVPAEQSRTGAFADISPHDVQFTEAAAAILIGASGDTTLGLEMGEHHRAHPPGTVWTALVTRVGGIRYLGDRIEVEPPRDPSSRRITCRLPTSGTWVEVTSAPGQVGLHVPETASSPVVVVVLGGEVAVAPGATKSIDVPATSAGRA